MIFWYQKGHFWKGFPRNECLKKGWILKMEKKWLFKQERDEQNERKFGLKLDSFLFHSPFHSLRIPRSNKYTLTHIHRAHLATSSTYFLLTFLSVSFFHFIFYPVLSSCLSFQLSFCQLNFLRFYLSFLTLILLLFSPFSHIIQPKVPTFPFWASFPTHKSLSNAPETIPFPIQLFPLSLFIWSSHDAHIHTSTDSIIALFYTLTQRTGGQSWWEGARETHKGYWGDKRGRIDS